MKLSRWTKALSATLLTAALLAGCSGGVPEYEKGKEMYKAQYEQAQQAATEKMKSEVAQIEQDWKDASDFDSEVEALTEMLTIYEDAYMATFFEVVDTAAVRQFVEAHQEEHGEELGQWQQEMNMIFNQGLQDSQGKLHELQNYISTERGEEYVQRINAALQPIAQEMQRKRAEERAANDPDLINESFSDEEIAAMADKTVTLKTNKGDITLGFFPDTAPNHVARFLELAGEGFYDGVQFHRVIPGFVIQGGDPETAKEETPKQMYGQGGSGKNIKLEPGGKHIRGSLGAARSQDPNSADSQFYIALAEIPHLDDQYTVFGEVLEGMEVADAIAEVESGQGDIPVEPVVIVETTVGEK